MPRSTGHYDRPSCTVRLFGRQADESGGLVVVVVARYRVRVGNLEAVAAALRDYAPLVRAEPGCLGFTVHRAREDPREFLLYERYRDDAALDAHRASTHFRAVAGVRIWPLLERRESLLYDEQ